MANDRVSVTAYGADGDATRYTGEDTDAFQAAIDDATGGGTVVVPPGTYAVGSVRFGDDVTLHLESGAVLTPSHDRADYDRYPEHTWPDGERPWLRFRDCANVTISGDGTIAGGGTDLFDMDSALTGHSGERPASLVANAPHDARQGAAFLDPDSTEGWPVAKPAFRPGPALLVERCSGVAIRDVSIVDMPAWTVSLVDSADVAVRDVTIDNDLRIPNCDGIAIDGSRNVRITGCAITSADDAITPQVDRSEAACENVTVTNCTLRTNACGVKIGSETAGDVRNLTVSNCTITGSNRGVGIQHRDAGDVENVLFSDLVIETRLVPGPWWGKAEPIYVTSLPRDENTTLGAVRNVRVDNVVCTSEAGAVVYGSPEATLETVRLDGVRVEVTDGEYVGAVGGNLDLQPTAVTAPIVGRDLPAVYCHGVDDLSVRDLAVEWDEAVPEYHTHALEVEDATDVAVAGFRGRGAGPGEAAIGLHGVTNWSGTDNHTRGDGPLVDATDVTDRGP